MRPVDHIHVPTPGQRYSPEVGSAIVTVVRALAAAHARAGGVTGVLVAEGPDHAGEAERLLLYRPTRRDWLSPKEKAFDAGLGRMGLPRRAAAEVYRGAVEAVPHDFAGPVFLHSGPQAVRLLQRLRPAAQPVVWVHNDLWRTWGWRERARLLSSGAVLVFVSEFMREVFLAGHDRADARTVVVLNGVDTSAITPAPSPRSGRPVVLFVGKLVPHKGAHLLLEAARRLHAEGLDFELRIAGRADLGPDAAMSDYERGLHEMAASMPGAVTFPGFVSRAALPDALRDADVYCVPSDWDDPCPLTVGEGLAAGLPTVTTRRGGVPEIGLDAVEYAEADPASLSDSLRRLLTDPGRRGELRRRARRRAESLTWDSRLALVERALGDRPGGGRG